MDNNEQNFINIVNATENNLKHVSLKIPKKKITVFTGVSGSGKSSLCLDTIAAESRRELNVTFPSFVQQFLPKYGRPEVERMENLPVTIVIDQKKPVANSRSTVGTYTDIYALLRLLFSRVGKPFVGYSDSFSFNHPSGKCERCEGLGVVTELDIHKLVDFDKCLNDEGVIKWPAFTTGAWRWKRYAWWGMDIAEIRWMIVEVLRGNIVGFGVLAIFIALAVYYFKAQKKEEHVAAVRLGWIEE